MAPETIGGRAALICTGLLVCGRALSGGTDGITVELGDPQVLLADGAHDLHAFPDAHLTILDTDPKYRVLLVAGVRTWLMEGPDMRSLAAVRAVLSPGPAGSFDNGYAGIFGVHRDEASGELLAFYHAEDHEDMPRLPNDVPGFYASIGLAVSGDDGLNFERLGPVLTGSQPKDADGRPDQGVGEGSIVPDRTGTHLYCYYTDHSRADSRGVQICLARTPLGSGGRPGTWEKYHEGAFGQPGLGGKDSPVLSAHDMQADAAFPLVTYFRELGRYVMVFCIVAYADLATGEPETSGICLATSSDGIHWSEPIRALRALTIPWPDRECAWHPALIADSVEDSQIAGWLYYAYSERWGWGEGRTPHYLVGRRITVHLRP